MILARSERDKVYPDEYLGSVARVARCEFVYDGHHVCCCTIVSLSLGHFFATLFSTICIGLPSVSSVLLSLFMLFPLEMAP